jgi:hypothetical protein
VRKSVFGMTEFHFPADDWRFPLVMICVCVPFFLLILALFTRTGMKLIKMFGAWVDSLFNPDRVRRLREKKLQLLVAKVREDIGQRKARRFGRNRRQRGAGADGAANVTDRGGKARKGWWPSAQRREYREETIVGKKEKEVV